jgi:branched-chain amino acid transport system substrate-binding protein
MKGTASLLASTTFCVWAATASAAPLTIAMVEASSGPGAETGVLWTEGVKYGVELLNEAGGFNGEPIKFAEYDNQSTPGGASDKLRAAIADGARIVVSAGSSAIAAQLSDDVRKYNLRNPGKEVIFITPGSQSTALTGEKCHFWFFRLTSNPFVRIKALTSVMKTDGALGMKVYSINQNYSYGQEMEKAQAEFVSTNGGKVVEATLHDIAKIQDFSPYVAKIKAAGAETVLTGNWGNDMVLLMKAAGNAGLKVRFGTTNLDNPGVIGSAGSVALGNYHVSPYNAEAGGEAGAAFAERYKAKFGHYPVFGAESTFAMMLLGEALKSVKTTDKSVDIKAIAVALENAKVTTPMGEMSVRKEDHQGIIPIAVAKVTKEAKYKADRTDMGLQLVRVVPGPEAAVPADGTCKMDRPS